jgi:hypothetical protein
MRPQPLIERVRARGRVLAFGLAAGFAVAVFAVSGVSAVPQSQVPTPTPFRFLTPTPATGTKVGVVTTRTPTAGGFPIELAIPALAGGLAALGGGAYLFRRKTVR